MAEQNKTLEQRVQDLEREIAEIKERFKAESAPGPWVTLDLPQNAYPQNET